MTSIRSGCCRSAGLGRAARTLFCYAQPVDSRTKKRLPGALALASWLVLCPLLAAGAANPPAAVPPAASAAESKAADNDYIIGPGDVLSVFVWRNSDLSVTAVPVRPDGKISTPLVEDMVAVGKTPPQLARDMEKVLGEYVREPKVNIIVTTPLSAFSQVTVVGQVTHPQTLPYRERMTVMDAILAVGGLGPFAAGNRARIVRNENGEQKTIRVKLADLLEKGAVGENMLLKPGDVLVVPQTFF